MKKGIEVVEQHRSGGRTMEPQRSRVRVCYLNFWADRLESVANYLKRVPALDVTARVADPADAGLRAKGRLDCDWYAENARCFANLPGNGIEWLPAWTCGPGALLEFVRAPREPGEQRWLVTMGQQPEMLGNMAGPAFGLLAKAQVRHLFYAFDEASRFMPCFRAIAPWLDVLIHDEWPLDSAAEVTLRGDCMRVHRSWVANVLPLSTPFNESPERKILFLGSQLGLTEHRRRQIAALQYRFKDRFVAIHDHSVSVASRGSLNRFQAALCPEGRKFATPGMSRSHTDRPFWSGCLGLVPVSENSRTGDRLEQLAAAGLIVRYSHGDLAGLAAACERALETSNEERRRIYEHFNQHETVGTVVADAIARAVSVHG